MNVLQRKQKGAVIWLIVLSGGAFAQTTNTGQLVIQPNTVMATVSDFDNQNGGSCINDGVLYVYGNFNNDGSVDFTSGQQGLTRFEGGLVQQLTGAANSRFYDVLFNNTSSPTASFELSGKVSVAHEADFTQGIVQNDGFGGTFQFEDGAGSLNVSDQSHVDGTVHKTGTDAFPYPVGDAHYYRFAAISAPTLQTDVFSGKYFFSNPNSSYPLANKETGIVSIDNQEYWEVLRTNGNSTVLLKLSWDENTTTPLNVLPVAGYEMHIVRWDISQNQWVDEGGLADISTKTVTTTVALDKFGIFTLALVNVAPEVVVNEGVTPNNDGHNDVLTIQGIEFYPNTKISIFNRWGTLVYESNDYQNNWDGLSESQYNIGGNKLPEGTYFYIMELGGTEGAVNYGKIFKGYFYLKRE